MGKKTAAVMAEVSDAELEAMVRGLIERVPGIARTEFKRELPKEYKWLAQRALEMARILAGRREIHRWAAGASKERFFTQEPFEALSKAVMKVLAAGPLDEAELKLRLENEGNGLSDLFGEWKKSALGRREIFAHAGKRFGLRAPEPAVSDAELEQTVRSIVERESGITRIEFKAALGNLGKEWQKLEQRALVIVETLATRSELFRWAKGKKERFFAGDPLDAVSRAVTELLAGGPREEGEIGALLESRGRGLVDVIPAWKARALEQGEVFEHPPQSGSRKKRLGLKPLPPPEVAVVLQGAFAALKKALESEDGRRLSRESVLAALEKQVAELLSKREPSRTTGSSGQSLGGDGEVPRRAFLAALRELAAENPSNAPLSVHVLRDRLELDKRSFDRLALELEREQLVTLLPHDFPASLSAAERAAMIEDERGTHYHVISFRRSHG